MSLEIAKESIENFLKSVDGPSSYVPVKAIRALLEDHNELTKPKERVFCGNFLWPYEDNSIEQIGYNLLNCYTEELRKIYWDALVEKIRGRNEN